MSNECGISAEELADFFEKAETVKDGLDMDYKEMELSNCFIIRLKLLRESFNEFLKYMREKGYTENDICKKLNNSFDFLRFPGKGFIHRTSTQSSMKISIFESNDNMGC